MLANMRLLAESPGLGQWGTQCEQESLALGAWPWASRLQGHCEGQGGTTQLAARGLGLWDSSGQQSSPPQGTLVG